MEAITIPHVRIPSINIGGICLPGIGAPGSIGKKGLIWPAGMKEHIKAWYDPKKQGMTNYDVIEAYTEDFTTWTVNKEGVIANVTSKSITITNVLNSNPLIYAYGTFSVRLRIDGLKNGQGIFFGDNKEYTISENGIYDIDTTENIRTNFIGECNITITQLPTSILKDFSGNGNHAYLYGGKGKLNSGMGVYQQDFSKLIISRVDKKQDPFSFTVSGSGGSYLAYMQLGNWNNKAFKILANINAKSDYLYLRFRNSTDAVITSVMLKNGENIIPAQNIEGATKAVFEYSLKEGETITITQIPDYPDQLCYDGKMYAVAYDMPILTDYTVMAERTILDNSDIADWAFIAKRDYPAINGAFTFEKDIDDASDNFRTISFGRTSVIYKPIKERSISYQTKNKYNGQDIIVGNVDDVDFLLIGAGILDTNLNLVKEKMRVAHGAIIIADRSFTEEEINWLKQNWDKI